MLSVDRELIFLKQPPYKTKRVFSFSDALLFYIPDFHRQMYSTVKLWFSNSESIFHWIGLSSKLVLWLCNADKRPSSEYHVEQLYCKHVICGFNPSNSSV